MIRILIVEDEKAISDLIRLNLMKAGYQCVCVYNGMKAADLLETENFDLMQGLTSGAEDYMVKPFEVVELLARVNIVLRRYHKMEQKITFMDIELDSENQVVTKTGKEVELTPKEFELLEILMRNRNITLFWERIYEEIWGTEYSVESRTLDLHIQRLRKKLNLGAELKTVFKAGYRLEDKA